LTGVGRKTLALRDRIFDAEEQRCDLVVGLGGRGRPTLLVCQNVCGRDKTAGNHERRKYCKGVQARATAAIHDAPPFYLYKTVMHAASRCNNEFLTMEDFA
jgi:hypothetical protein